MKHSTATRKDHLRFCEIEGWLIVRSSRGKRGTHHDTFELALPNGDVLRTRISRPPDRTDYGKAMWSHILTDQLRVTEDEFWRCVGDRAPPDRGGRPEPSSDPIPTDVIWALITKVGLSEDEVAAMSNEQAVERLQLFWMKGESSQR